MCIQLTKRLVSVASWSLPCAALVLTVAVIGGSPAAAFQDRELSDEQIAQIRERMQETRERLNLTDAQIEQVTPILRAGFEAQMEVLEKHGVDFRNPAGERSRLRLRQLRRLRGDLEEVRERTVEQLSDVLSEEQIEVYKEIQEERRQANSERIRERIRQRR